MAIIKYGSIIVNGSGKIGGHFLARGQGGATLCTNGARPPRNPQLRKLWGYIKRSSLANSLEWRNLSDAERAAWGADSANWPTENKVGDFKVLRGYNHFMRVNNTLASHNFPTISVPAPKVVLPDIGGITITVLTPTTIGVAVNNAFSAPNVVVLCATRTMSAGATPMRKDFRILTCFDDTTVYPVDVISEYEYICGNPVPEGTIYFMAYILNTSNGQKGLTYHNKKVVI